MSAAELVDWRIAHAVAAQLAGENENRGERGDLERAGERAADAVRGYTRLEPQEPLPHGEWVSRREWARINIEGLRATLSQVPSPSLGGEGVAGAVGAALTRLAGGAGGLQLGLLAGYAARNVLGQYEYPLLGGDRPPRLIYVRANLAAVGERLSLEPEPLLDWVALHETTHAVHFAAAPWLRGHVGGLALELLRSGQLNPDLGELAGRARELLGGERSEILGRLRAADPISLLTPAAAQPALGAIQATMSAVEGFAEHVMDAALPALGSDPARMRERLEGRRRNRPPHARLLAWLLGLELKLRQYREGKRFCDETVAAAGIERLNRAWEGAGMLPTGDEIGSPEHWLARTDRVAGAP